MIDKTVRSVAEALAGIKDGSTVLIAGFAQVGEPRALIDGLIEQGARDLTVVHNTAGRGREGVARLIGEGRVRKIVCSFARSRGSVIFVGANTSSNSPCPAMLRWSRRGAPTAGATSSTATPGATSTR